MQTKIAETTNIGGLGSPVCRKLMKVQSGSYAGRMIAMFKTSNNEIKYSSAVNPYSSWSEPVTVVTDSANTPLDLFMSPNGDVSLVYVESSTSYLVYIKLTITESGWNSGSKIYIYNGNLTNTPSITIDKNGTLYVTFARFNGAAFDLQTKSSADGGATWGTGPADIGDTLMTGASIVIPKVMTSSDNLFVVFTVDYNEIKESHRLLSGGNWSTAYTIGTGASVSTKFDAQVLPEGFLGVVYDDDQLIYREFNGINWSPAIYIDPNTAEYPQLKVINNVPVIFYISERDTGQNQLFYSSRISGTFSTPKPFEIRSDVFNSVLLYDTVSSSFSDKTVEAGSNIPADIYHSSSTVLFQQVGDQLFVGSDSRFRFLNILLSTAGSGGTVIYSFYDGLNWIAFSPLSGNYNFDATGKELSLWQDFKNTPDQWQKTVVNGFSRFWIKIEVSSLFTTAPIGSQLTSISNLKAVSVRR